MRIFISHASEDKADFVRPLAEALRQYHEIWFDEYELQIGHSLFEKINSGLSACDYGVVVLSPSFFQKKWPRAELDGLFALETSTRKIILPIWKDVVESDVRAFSPMLADRVACKAADGIAKVVNDVRRAVEISGRTRELIANGSIIERARRLNQTLEEKREAERLSHCEEGVALVQASFDALREQLKTTIAQLPETFKELKVQLSVPARQSFGPRFFVSSGRINLDVTLRGLGANYTYETSLHVLLYEHGTGFAEINKIRETSYTFALKPPDRLVWVHTKDKKVFRVIEMADSLLEMLFQEVERKSIQGNRPIFGG